MKRKHKIVKTLKKMDKHILKLGVVEIFISIISNSKIVIILTFENTLELKLMFKYQSKYQSKRP